MYIPADTCNIAQYVTLIYHPVILTNMICFFFNLEIDLVFDNVIPMYKGFLVLSLLFKLTRF